MKRNTHTIDASGQILGRLASRIAVLLQGKHKPTWAPHKDEGDTVVIENVSKIQVTGNKLSKKIYYWHTGYPGHLRSETLEKRMAKNPGKVLHDAVYNMLPKNKLRKGMLKRLIIKE